MEFSLWSLFRAGVTVECAINILELTCALRTPNLHLRTVATATGCVRLDTTSALATYISTEKKNGKDSFYFSFASRGLAEVNDDDITTKLLPTNWWVAEIRDVIP